MVRSRRSRSPSVCTASRHRTTRRAPRQATSSSSPTATSHGSGSGGWAPARIVDFTSPDAEEWWASRSSACSGRASRASRWTTGTLLPEGGRATGRRPSRRRGRLAARRPAPHQPAARARRGPPGAGVLFGRSGWIGQHAVGHTWAADQGSDFWSLRALVVASCRQRPAACPTGATTWAATSGIGGRALPTGAAGALAAVRLLSRH